MNNSCNVIALNPTPRAMNATSHSTDRSGPIIRTTAAFRALLDTPQNGADMALLRMINADVENAGLSGYVTWSIDEICNVIIIRQWPSCRVLDLVPFPVHKLSRANRALRFAAWINSETATLGIADDPDAALRDENGHSIGSRIGVFP